MEDSDKTISLKKAYAEIILNTAKEAAARVMASESKSLRFQQDLGSTKDEALRLLVRLKQMIDAKTIESEITSSNQQRRIDELEAQLQEAEDIITDLRAELRWVRNKLEKVRMNKVQSINATNVTEEAVSSQNANQEVVSSFNPNEEVVDTHVCDTRGTLLNQSSLNNECGSEAKLFDELSVSILEPCDAHESELDDIMRNKELELYRNGCTQRIRALERKALDGNLSPDDIGGQCIPGKDYKEGLSSGKVNDDATGNRGKMRCTVLALRAGRVEVMKKPSNVLGSKKASKSCKLRKRRKRRWGKAKATSRRSRVGQLIKTCQSLSNVFRSKSSMDNADGNNPSEMHLSGTSEKVDVLKTCKELEEHLQRKRTLYNDEISIIRKGKRAKNMKSLDSITSPVKPTDQLAGACQESNLISVNAKCGEDKPKVPDNYEAKIKLLPRLDPGLTLIRSNVDPVSGSTNVTVSVKGLIRSKPASDKDLESRDTALLVKQENIAAPPPDMGSETVNAHLVHSDLKVAEVSEEITESPGKADGNRLVKYTFQRKRKKGSLSDNDDNNCSTERKVDEKENEALDRNESSRGTQQLNQVTQQSISPS